MTDKFNPYMYPAADSYWARDQIMATEIDGALTFEWDGNSNHAAITRELIESADPEHFSFINTYRLKIGPFTLMVIGYDFRRDCLVCKKI